MRLRLLDLGGVSGLRSQAVYHALSDSVSEGGPDTLAILYPTNPYVSLGFHRDLDADVDAAFCAERGLPVYRRRVGGGTVYLNSDQVFFQLIVHERHVRMTVERAYAQLLAPAVAAYRALGVPAELMGVNDLAVAGRKLSGTGMATIGDATVLVGNVIRDLDHATMAGILRLPDAHARRWVEASMRRWVTSIQEESGAQPDYSTVAAALGDAYAGWAGEPLEPGEPTDRELALIERTEERLLSAEWLHRDGFEWATAPASPVRRVKIRSGRWDSVFDWSLGRRPVRVYLSAEGGVVEAIEFRALDGGPPHIGATGATLDKLAATLTGIDATGPRTGERVAGIVAAADAGRLARLLAVAARPDG